MSNLGEHARRELELIGEDPQAVEAIVKIADIFVETFDSGGAHDAGLELLIPLLQHKNLRPLTDDPDEWIRHSEEVWGEKGGIWQNKRNTEAFSNDGGKTYKLNSEFVNGRAPIHFTKHVEKQGV